MKQFKNGYGEFAETQASDGLWTLTRCAGYLGVSVHFLYKNYKKFPHVRINRNIKFIPSEVKKHVKGQQRMPSPKN